MKKTVILILALIGLIGAIFVIWQNQNERTKAAKLDAEILKGLSEKEIALVLKSEAVADRQSIAALLENSEKRQIFLKGMREYLALAAEARRQNFAEDTKFKINLEYKKNILLADLYRAELSRGKDKLFVVSDDETKVVWANAENEESFNKDMNALLEIQKEDFEASGNQTAISKLEGDNLTKARENWARAKILSNRAKSDADFMQKPEIALRLKIVEAAILAKDYLRENWVSRIKATDAEIKNYLESHPKFDVEKKRQKAETILQKVRAGEDFTKLAKEFSEDRPTKNKGGLYENVAQNVLWAEVEKAALDLENGQVADYLIESEIGYHIVKLENKKIVKNSDGGESVKFSVRHVLLQKRFEEPNNKIPGIPPPFMTAEEIAKAEIQREKRAAFVGEIIKQNPVSLPEDFALDLPPIEGVQPNAAKPANE